MQQRRINVRGIIFKDGKLLVQTFKTTEGESSHWGTPGGGLELGESLHDGLHRELIEETGITPVIGKLLFVEQFRHDTKEFLEFFFHIENPEAYETIDLAETSHGLLEISRCEFIDPKTANVLPSFLQAIDIEAYLRQNLPVYIDNDLST